MEECILQLSSNKWDSGSRNWPHTHTPKTPNLEVAENGIWRLKHLRRFYTSCSDKSLSINSENRYTNLPLIWCFLQIRKLKMLSFLIQNTWKSMLRFQPIKHIGFVSYVLSFKIQLLCTDMEKITWSVFLVLRIKSSVISRYAELILYATSSLANRIAQLQTKLLCKIQNWIIDLKLRCC